MKIYFFVTLIALSVSFLFSEDAFAFNQAGVIVEASPFLNQEEISWLQAHPKITVAFDGNFPPYSYLENNVLHGVAIDYFRLIEQKIGIKFNVSTTHVWHDIFNNAISDDRTIDVIATMVSRENRKKWFNFTPPYIFKSLVVITRKNESIIQQRKDIESKTIALVKNYQYVDKILKEFPNIVPYYVPSIHDALGAVEAGKADGMIGFIAVADWYRKKYMWDNLHIAALFDRNSANDSIAIRKDWPILANIITKALHAISNEEKAVITNKWLPDLSIINNNDALTKQLKLIYISAFVLLFAVFYLRNQNKKIKQAELLANEANKKLISLSNNLESEVQERTDKLFQLSYYDNLTLLGNKNLFFKKVKLQIEQSQEAQKTFALLTLGIDRFKYINDTLGHKVGDDIIKQIAQRLSENRFPNDIVTRFGGDEFNVLLADISIENTFDVVHNLVNYLKQPYLVHDTPINLTVSVGISMFPQDGVTVASLMPRSEQAMYKAKDEKSGFEFSSLNVAKNFSDYLQLEQALLHAIHELNDENKPSPFILYYQPVKWLNKTGLKGLEALIRWQHQSLGWISPDRFITLAEDIGKIELISRWVRTTAFKQAKIWHDQGLCFGRISINLSPTELQNPQLITFLKDEITHAGARFEWIDIEITETAILKNPIIALDMLKKIKALGVTISIDDFGTGYSSLVYLKKIPANTVKIDREFIKNLPHDKDDIIIDRSIIELSHGLNKVITAEGVETKEQLELLKALGCDSIQGYYLSKPLPANLIHKDCEFFDDAFCKSNYVVVNKTRNLS